MFMVTKEITHIQSTTPKVRALHELNPDCWMCKSLREPAHLVFFESRTSIGKLNPDQFFRGYSFVTLRWHREELFQLSDRDRKEFLEDMSRVAAALAKSLSPDKMNYELLGNGMPHLHWHLVPGTGTILSGAALSGPDLEEGRSSRGRITRIFLLSSEPDFENS